MQFSNTTTKDGLIQRFEYWTRQPDGTVTGTLLLQVTASINNAFDMLMPFLLSYSRFIRWDDTNNTDRPIGRFNIVSGQPDYTIAEDDNSLDILNVTRARILNSATATQRQELQQMFINDPRATEAMSPNPTPTGVPTHFLEQGNSLFLYPKPNYAATEGVEIFFERQQSYFVSTDTTKEPGFPRPFHELLALYAAHDWIIINRPDDAATITRIEARIGQKQQDMTDMISKRNPTRTRMTTLPSAEFRRRGFNAQSGRINGFPYY